MSEVRLLTLSEAADQTGLTVDALRKRIKRGRLRSFRGNDGLVRVRLNDAEIDALRADGPSSRPASQLTEESPLVRVLESHVETLRVQLDKAELRAQRAEERAEKAEQRLIAELARLAGQNVGASPQTEAPDLGPDQPEDADFEELLSELRLEFEGERRELLPEQLPNPAFEPKQIEAPPLPEPESVYVVSLVPESRRVWWSRFVPLRRRS